ncbi:unnamed protein product [Microthlaspi erraticum]|uniref:Arabidopsis retrotransposon Orf1 C-terminal domain-containing protein n=1 Tax=Microthlaspi erraticum TaxID=1685480 RepID=A0A6D2LCE3_9BRAS|nr:unnamed protein product [Microthlaspi erraticum]
MRLAKFFSYRMESYKELTCSLEIFWFHYGEGTHWESRKDELQRVWATIAEEVLFLKVQRLLRSGAQCLRYVHKALANTFFARKALGQSMKEVKLLDMGIKPIISRTRMGRIRGDRSCREFMPLLDQLSPTRQAYTLAGVHDKRRSTPAGWMDIKFCKTNLLIEHKELDGRFQFKFTHPLAGPSKLLLPNPELTTEEPELDRAEDRAEDKLRNADLGEPECYYFEEYEAPRMNPSVVAAHKRIGLLQRFNKWQGKAMERCKSPWTRW